VQSLQQARASLLHTFARSVDHFRKNPRRFGCWEMGHLLAGKNENILHVTGGDCVECRLKTPAPVEEAVSTRVEGYRESDSIG